MFIYKAWRNTCDNSHLCAWVLAHEEEPSGERMLLQVPLTCKLRLSAQCWASSGRMHMLRTEAIQNFQLVVRASICEHASETRHLQQAQCWPLYSAGGCSTRSLQPHLPLPPPARPHRPTAAALTQYLQPHLGTEPKGVQQKADLEGSGPQSPACPRHHTRPPGRAT